MNIPDANFKAYLLSANASNNIARNTLGNFVAIDSNGDGEIQYTEASVITGLYIDGAAIVSITGIEAFINLTDLGCYANIPTIDASMFAQLETFGCMSVPAVTSINLGGLVNLKQVNCHGNELTSLNLSGDVNLEWLLCYDNNLTSLDVSNFSHLTHLECDYNNLTSLNVTGCTALNFLRAERNQLTSLNISGLISLTTVTLFIVTDQTLTNLNASGCSALTTIDFNSHSLATVDFSGCSALTSLGLNSNNLTSLNLSGCSALTNLDISFNDLTSLDVSNCVALTDINAFANQLTTFDASNCQNLNTLNVQTNPLSTLFIKNGHDETNVNFNGDDLLQFICVDESQLASVQSAATAASMTGVVINSYCSFTPGGDYNTIGGAVRLDADNNGCDASDVIPPNLRLTLNDGTTTGATFTNNLGSYTFYISQTGNFSITPTLENPGYFNISPATATLNFPLVDNTIQTQNFCMSANGVHPDLEIILVPQGNARPGFDADYALVYKNKGNQTMSGSVNLVFDDAHTDFVSASPNIDSQSVNNLSWNFSNLLPFQTRIIYLTLNVNSTVENPPVHVGDFLDFTATINPPSGDETPSDNTFNLHQHVVNSLDPNDKTCLEGTTVTPENIGKYLHYNINFENTGTSDAVNVVVKDVIDTTKFDINSLQLLYSSYPAYTRINGNVVEFIFENINLPPSAINPIGGHGNVLFKIKTLPGLPIGTEVSNTAGIYFDYNAPIATNTARTTFAALSKTDFKKDDSINIYPNPTAKSIHVSAGNIITSMQLYDIQGRILQEVSLNAKNGTLDISSYNNGIYFVNITTQKGATVEKIIKED